MVLCLKETFDYGLYHLHSKSYSSATTNAGQTGGDIKRSSFIWLLFFYSLSTHTDVILHIKAFYRTVEAT